MSVAMVAVAEHGAEWFPHLDGTRIAVAVAGRKERPRGMLARLRLQDGQQEAYVVVKAHQRPGIAAAKGSVTRPTLMPPEPLPAAEMAQYEFNGLRMISTGFRDSDCARFGIARPLAWLPEHAAFVMDYVADPPLRHQLMARSRLRPKVARSGDAAWVNAGAWLRIYHGLRPAGSVQPRIGQQARVAELFEPYAEFLAGRTGGSAFFATLARIGAQRAHAWLPSDLPQAVGHGDFAVRNLFESPAGRITTIDPMPRWLVPPYEDLARFIVGVRLLGLQIVSQGVAFGQRQLDAYEAALVRGYFGAEPIPQEELRVYQLLILMDKWSAALGPVPRSLRARLVGVAGRRWSGDYFRREARRLVSGPSRG